MRRTKKLCHGEACSLLALPLAGGLLSLLGGLLLGNLLGDLLLHDLLLRGGLLGDFLGGYR